MQAARLHANGKPLVIDDVPRPTPGPGQVVIRVEGAGFCHNDLHIISGDIQILPRMPFTLGHENAGTVAGIGVGVHAVKEGDHVAVYGGWGDGFCDYCVTGEENLCPLEFWPLEKINEVYARQARSGGRPRGAHPAELMEAADV